MFPAHIVSLACFFTSLVVSCLPSVQGPFLPSFLPLFLLSLFLCFSFLLSFFVFLSFFSSSSSFFLSFFLFQIDTNTSVSKHVSFSGFIHIGYVIVIIMGPESQSAQS